MNWCTCTGRKRWRMAASTTGIARCSAAFRRRSGWQQQSKSIAAFPAFVEEHAVLVYLANVYIHDAEYEFEYSQNLGVFKNEGDARLAVEVFRQDNSTRWEVDGLIVEWSVDQYTLDEMNCIDGFEY